MKNSVRRAFRVARARWSGLRQTSFHCPNCDYRGPFENLVQPGETRLDARCPGCGALERHRLQFLVVQAVFDDRNPQALRMLHFAPEPFFQDLFRPMFAEYETADLMMEGVDHRVNLEALSFEDASYDVVFASHVLEHVPDDRKEIYEIRRILRPGGLAILPVPIVAEKTEEYGEARPEEHYHVRAPGPDYIERLVCAFSHVTTFDSDHFPARHQLYARRQHKDGVQPIRDLVPVCYV